MKLQFSTFLFSLQVGMHWKDNQGPLEWKLYLSWNNYQMHILQWRLLIEG